MIHEPVKMPLSASTPNSSAIVSLIAMNGICIDGAADVNTDSLFENHSPMGQHLSEARLCSPCKMCSTDCVDTKDKKSTLVQEQEIVETDGQCRALLSPDSVVKYRPEAKCLKEANHEIPREKLPEVGFPCPVVPRLPRRKKLFAPDSGTGCQKDQASGGKNVNLEGCSHRKSFLEGSTPHSVEQSGAVKQCSNKLSLMPFQEQSGVLVDSLSRQNGSTESLVSSIGNQQNKTLILPSDFDSTCPLEVIQEFSEMTSRSDSEDDEREAQCDDDVCSDNDHELEQLDDEREEETQIDLADGSFPDFSGEVSENCNYRSGRGGRGNVRGGGGGNNKRWTKKNKAGKGNRGRGNNNNNNGGFSRCDSKVDDGENGNNNAGDNFNISSEFFKITDENGNIVSNRSNTKGFKSRDEVHDIEAQCLLGKGLCQPKKQEMFAGKGSPVNNSLLFGNNGTKKASVLYPNGDSSNKPGGNNSGPKGNNNNNNYNNNNQKNNSNSSNNNNNNNQKNNSNSSSSSNNNKGGGDLKWDVVSRHLKHLCYSLGLLKRNNGPGFTLESLCLEFHYRFLVLFFCVCYFVVALDWYKNEQIVCYKMGASQTPQTGPYRDMCLSYPYVATASGARRYLLYYRWVPNSFLLVAAVVYTLRAGPVKKWEDTRLAQLCKDVWMERSSYQTSHWTNINDRVVRFITTGQAESGHYYKWILCHVFANLLVLAAVFYFDFVLQGTFVTMVPEVMYKMHRDPMHFSDPLSIIFPPFADCQITQFHKVIDSTEFNFGCHLTLMELYEKLFFVTWCVLALHWFWSSVMILWLTVGLIPFFGKFSCLVTSHLKYKDSAVVMWKVVRKCSLGEAHALYLVKKWMSCAQFDQLLATLLAKKSKNGLLDRAKNSDFSSDGERRNYCSNHTALQMGGCKLPCIDGNAHQMSDQSKEDPAAPTIQLLSGKPASKYGRCLDEAYIDRFYSAQSSPGADQQESEDKPGSFCLGNRNFKTIF